MRKGGGKLGKEVNVRSDMTDLPFQTFISAKSSVGPQFRCATLSFQSSVLLYPVPVIDGCLVSVSPSYP